MPSAITETLGPYVPRIEDYFGLWCIQPEVAEAIEGRFNQLDKLAHVREQKLMARAGAAEEDDGLGYIEDGIGFIRVQGVLQKRSSSLYATSSVVRLRAKVREFAQADNVQGIALLIESPGGQASGVPELAEEIQRAGQSKPVRAFIEDLGASGAYWVASAAQQISANAGAMVGSIGVFTVVQDTSRQAEEMGIKVHVVKAGDMKAASAWGVEVSQEYLDHLKTELIDPTYQQFTSAVAMGRRMSTDEVAAVASGKVWHAQRARDLRLVDNVESLEQFTTRFKQELKAMSAETTKPRAATMAELKAAFTDSTADWRESQVEAGATIEQAAVSYGKWCETRVADAEKRAAAAEAATVKTPLETVDGLAGSHINGTGQPRGTVTGERPLQKQFAALIDEKVKAGMSRPSAYNQVCTENPALLEAVIAEANAPKTGK